MRAFVLRRAEGATLEDPKPAHWIHGANEFEHDELEYTEADKFCFDCCKIVVKRTRRKHGSKSKRVGLCVNGGWSIEHDSQPFCELCGCRLSFIATDYFCEQEIEHWLLYGPPHSPNEWLELTQIMDHVYDYTHARKSSDSIFAPSSAPIGKHAREADKQWIAVWSCVYRCMKRATQRRPEHDEEQARVLREASQSFYIHQVNLRMEQRSREVATARARGELW
jgi:hypothetical protein